MSSVIRKVHLEEIKKHLQELGAKNQADNINSISTLPDSGTPNYYLIRLSEDEFFNLVFLQNGEVLSIAPRDQDRRLRSVADRAFSLYKKGKSQLSHNWDIELNYNRFKEIGADTLPALVLRDTRNSEKEYEACWYLQDGCHRALAYAMAVLNNEAVYSPQLAYCATVRTFDEAA